MEKFPKQEKAPERKETRLEVFEREAKEKYYEYLLAKNDALFERIVEIEHGPDPEYSEPGAPKLTYPAEAELEELKANGEEVAEYLFEKLQKDPSHDIASALLRWMDLTEIEPKTFTKEDVRRVRDSIGRKRQ